MSSMRIFHLGLLLVVFLSTTACKKTGYSLTLTTELMAYSNIEHIERLLQNREYRFGNYRSEKGALAVWKERAVQVPRYRGEVYSLLDRRIDARPDSLVQVYLLYVKDSAGDAAAHCRIIIENPFTGLIRPEVKSEIDNLGDSVYQELEAKGVQGLKIERKEVSPPAFY